jgi:hypothetical protein
VAGPGPWGRGPARAAIVSTITAAAAPGATPIAVPYVGTVFPARPTILQEADYFQSMTGVAIQQSVGGSAAALVVNLPGKDHRERMTLTGRGHVDDLDKIRVVLEVWFACSPGLGQMTTPGPGVDPGIQAQEDYDSIVDALRVLIRNTPDLSAPDSIWSSGEYRAGVDHEQGQPFTPDGMSIVIIGSITWEVWQWIAGTNV